MARMRMKSEVRQYVKSLRLKERNWQVTFLKSGHLEVRDMNNGKIVAILPSSPSDVRWRKNQEAHIRRYLAEQGVQSNLSPTG